LGMSGRRESASADVGTETASRLPALRLVDRAAPLVAALRRTFVGTSVEVVEGDILTLARGCALVSPANSFGDMGGGLDLAIRRAYRPFRIEDAVRRTIAETAAGELPVGCAIVVGTPGQRFSHLVVAPTMRTPQVVADTLNAYLAFRAALLAVCRRNGREDAQPVRTLVCPGLGTGVGRLPPEVAARQMRAAWDAVTRPLQFRSLAGEAAAEARLRGAPTRRKVRWWGDRTVESRRDTTIV